MALNKSTKNTPGSRSGYFSDLPTSTGKQSNFLLPVRIKLTPTNTLAPLSDGKKHPSKMIQPVLIKDLLQSEQKRRHNSTVTSASTQKKKNIKQSNLPYLNTQSCYKPKSSEEEESFFFKKQAEARKVRRQLYQTLDSPQKCVLKSKENINKAVKPKTKFNQENEEFSKKTTVAQNKIRKSFLLPPNSIKNSIVRKSEATNLKNKQNDKKASTVSKKSKHIHHFVGARKFKSIKNHIQESQNNTDVSTSDEYEHSINQLPEKTRDNYTMTTLSIENVSSNIFSSGNFDRPSVIMNPLKINATSKFSTVKEPLNLELQNFNNDAQKEIIKVFDETIPPNLNFFRLSNMDYNNYVQFKFFLEQSVSSCKDQALNFKELSQSYEDQALKHKQSSQACEAQAEQLKKSSQTCEDQAVKLKQVLSFVDSMIFNATTVNTSSNENSEYSKTDDKSNISTISQNNVNATDIDDKSLDCTKKFTDNLNVDVKEIISSKEINNETNKTPIPRVLINNTAVNIEMKEISLENLENIARLSTIGEVSCESEESNKFEINISENKENTFINENSLLTPNKRTPKNSRRKSITSCDSQNRRRSARLAAKQMSLSSSDIDNTDSFILLEEELNVVHRPISSKSLPASPMKPMVPSKSLPASPMKPPMTPNAVKLWNKKIERPLKEYMALKVNSSLLMTPDVAKFQSRLEPTDTPHSRKSQSRKIFMELCDLYGESPESN